MQNVLDVIREFDTVIDDAVGLYLDAQAAMIQYANSLTKTQSTLAAQGGIPIEQFDSLLFTYGRGDPNDPKSLALHRQLRATLKQETLRGEKIICC